MGTAILQLCDYRYLPYEVEFARREIQTVVGHVPQRTARGFEVALNGTSVDALRRLTYVKQVLLPSGECIIPDQAALETATPNPRRGLTRQSTRYSAHCLHEYRGRFNPQVVRAIANMLSVDETTWILDPFCGSGTTLLECAHAGWNAVGLDLNPLAIIIANAKLAAYRADPKSLGDAVERLTQSLNEATRGLHYDSEFPWASIIALSRHPDEWPVPNLAYLNRWFSESALAQFVAILRSIDREVTPELRDVFRVLLSDIVRDASHQEPADLRIRRRLRPLLNYPVVPTFLKSAHEKISAVIAARSAVGRVRGQQQAYVFDNREPLVGIPFIQDGNTRPAIAITSPPYATALPYVDTQRLSLCLLGLIDADCINQLDRSLTGARDITESPRSLLEQQIESGRAGSVSPAVGRLCERLLSLARGEGNGFRRRNVPSVILRYFEGMGAMFENVGQTFEDGGRFALVVGRNSTTLGGERVTIETPSLLADVAAHRGWQLEAMLELDAYPRYDLHSRNSITTECLVVLSRSSHAAD